MGDVLSHVLTFIAGLAAGVVVKIRFDASRRSVSANTVSGDSQGKVEQSGNTVRGHMSGRDVNVRD
ncbi:hypothetical protein ABIF73_004428 [Bradyrhizobium japonicum]|uniref:Uncharacterized protein n=1 Tax=Bradyrhizobium australiense TaxID=2721161 RepID=A0A7Y4LW12_9BRAD|nr:hypothetical protein [Bradyrhizobium australiense]NOJ40918.1 hypothetical protein [Bradyrhizobium australiense]